MNSFGIIGTGKSIPSKKITNTFVSKKVKKSPSWIYSRTGIKNRYIVSKKETSTHLATKAAIHAIKNSKINKKDIGLIIGCNYTSDYTFPGLAVKVHQNLKLKNCGAFDLNANCTGFQIGLSTAAEKLKNDNKLKYILVIGTCVQSPFINWKYAETSMYFGDGSAAAVVGKVPKGYGYIGSSSFCNSYAYDDVRLRAGGSMYPLNKMNKKNSASYYEMSGLETWKQAVTYQPLVILNLLKKYQLNLNSVDFFIFHQANKNLIDYMMSKLKVSKEKTLINVDKYGNTGDASIAIALDEALSKKKIKKNDKVVISGVGAGFIFGASLFKWY